MRAEQLFTKKQKPTGVFFCTKCRVTHRTEEAADSCCVCVECKEKQREQHKIYCTECLAEYETKRDAKDKADRQILFDVAEEVTDYEFVWWSEGCVPDVQEILDDCMYDDLKDVPEFVFAMKPVKFSDLDVDKLFDDFDEDRMCEDLTCRDVLRDCDVLEDAVRAFNETNKNRTIFWQEDTTRKVRIPKDDELE